MIQLANFSNATILYATSKSKLQFAHSNFGETINFAYSVILNGFFVNSSLSSRNCCFSASGGLGSKISPSIPNCLCCLLTILPQQHPCLAGFHYWTLSLSSNITFGLFTKLWDDDVAVEEDEGNKLVIVVADCRDRDFVDGGDKTRKKQYLHLFFPI